MRLALRNVLFTLVVPGAGAVYAPWWILTRGGGNPQPVIWPAVAIITGGVVLYLVHVGGILPGMRAGRLGCSILLVEVMSRRVTATPGRCAE